MIINNGIFFFVTSGAVDLEPRESCCIEAAANLHPGRRVFVIFIRENITDPTEDSRTLLTLLSYENVYLRYIKLPKYGPRVPLPCQIASLIEGCLHFTDTLSTQQ